MSHVAFDFLSESFLFDENNLNNFFRKFTDLDLKKELNKYREYIINNIDDVLLECKDNHENTSVLSQIFNSKMISIDMLKQSSLYIHKFILDDPIFKVTNDYQTNELKNTMNAYLGMSADIKVNRKDLVHKIKYMKNLSYAVYSDYIKFIPGSYLNEPPKEIPLRYSDNYFAELRNENIRKFFYDNITISPMKKTEEGLIVLPSKKLEPCREIFMELKDHPGHPGYFYMLFEQKMVSMNDKTREVVFQNYLPESPPDKPYFEAWVYQSLNQVADRFCSNLETEILLANKLNIMYLTESNFVDKLLKLEYKQSQRQSDIRKVHTANNLLKLKVPIIEERSLNEILEIRNKEGEAFEVFRNDIENKLSELRTVKEQTIIDSKLKSISYELEEGSLKQINKSIKSLRKSLIRNSTVILGSLAWNLITSDLNILATGLALQQGYVTYKEYKDSIKNNPAYFLLKVDKQKQYKEFL
ncbi:hypothetical protein [Clostridium sp. ZS2-4]|uniref:hypothetical protein n=1 Tax=Clostridium sp. ZS2-4 TaxID=2987703 RepID=UPI00227A0F87|nr:hypothetical protein [Clostridium sp. ZS2-4]MCY6354384.1 hypothetical protein [Clostridium sp. ZS2-4]